MGIRLRPAEPSDATYIARMLDMATEGFAYYSWAQIAEPGEDAWSVGRRRSAGEESEHSWRSTVIAEIDGSVAGGMVIHLLPDAPAPLEAVSPPFRPARLLENSVPGTQNVYMLATLPEFRRRGVARLLLAEAERRSAGSNGVSLLVVNRNGPALALYHASGYVELGRAPIVKPEGWTCDSDHLVLLVKRCPSVN